jgi:hypothetical protein
MGKSSSVAKAKSKAKKADLFFSAIGFRVGY